jgi:ABC-type transporter Mla subunit MlaD
MAQDETTRQVNKRAIDALQAALAALGNADVTIARACDPLEDLSRTTNAHDALLEQIEHAQAQVREAHHEARRRLTAESEGIR